MSGGWYDRHDAQVGGDAVNRTYRRLQPHRILWVWKMDDDEIRRAREGEPTMDHIDVAAFDSQEKVRQWVSQMVPAFAGGPLVAL